MKAAVFHKPKDIRYENVDDPRMENPRDAIVRVTNTAICGSDLCPLMAFEPVNPRKLHVSIRGFSVQTDIYCGIDQHLLHNSPKA